MSDPESTPLRIVIRLLGPWDFAINGQSLPRPSTQKALSLLGYLVTHSDTAQPREKLATLLWPDADDDRAQRSLRTALWSIRRLLEQGSPAAGPQLDTALVASRLDVRWRPTFPTDVDVQRFEALVMSRSATTPGGSPPRASLDALQEAVTLYRGPLLEGIYDDWCVTERYHLEERYLQLLELLVAALESAGRPLEAIGCAQRLLEVDPLREELHATVIRLLGNLGDRAGVQRQYQRCKDILQQELDVAPGPEVEAAYKVARAAPPIPPSAPTNVAPIPDQWAASDQLAQASQHRERTGWSRPTAHSPLVGRTTQQERLRQLLDTLKTGQGHAALIAGEAGYGKTRLFEDLADQARKRDMRVFWGSCLEYERLLPYQPFVEALRTGIRLGAPDAHTLEGLPPIWQQSLLILLPEWAARLHPPAVPLLTRPGEEQRQLVEGIGQLLIALAQQQPVVLVIEDLHWAAESTLQLFHHLARLAPRHALLVLGSYRPEDLPSGASTTGVERSSTESPGYTVAYLQRSLQLAGLLDVLTLDPFSSREVASLLTQATDVTSSDPALAERLHAYTEGNPLFVVAALEMLAAGSADSAGVAGLSNLAMASEIGAPSEHVLSEPLQSITTSFTPDMLPERIRSLFEARVDRMSAPTREVLRIAAVAGREFDLVVLEQLWGKNEDAMLQAVDEMLAARLVKENDAPSRRDFSFSHHLLQKTIYASIPRVSRTRLHNRLATAMIASYGGQNSPSELAYHYALGGSPALAAEQARLAADQAAARYANADALHYYGLALSLLDQDSTNKGPAATDTDQVNRQRFELLAARLVVRRLLGMLREEEEDVQSLLSLAAVLGDPIYTTRAILCRADLEWNQGRYAALETTAQEALALIRAATPPSPQLWQPLEARAYQRLGDAYQYHDRYALAEAAYIQALTAYRALQQLNAEQRSFYITQEVTLLNNLGNLHGITGDYPAARARHEQALALCRSVRDLAGEAMGLIDLGNVSWHQGDLLDAQRYYEEALALYRRMGDRGGEANCLRNLGMAHMGQGRLEIALDNHRQSLAIRETQEDQALLAECHRSLGDVRYLLGQHDLAQEAYARSLHLARLAGSNFGTAQSLLGCSRVARTLGKAAEAQVFVAEARELCTAIGYRRGLAWCDREAGLGQADLGDHAAARDLLQQASMAFAALGEPSLLCVTRAEVALAHLALGDLPAAQECAEQAAALIDQPGRGVDQPQAVLWILYRVLASSHLHARAKEALIAAQAALQAQAEQLSNGDLRASFLNAVPVNQSILHEVAKM